MKNTKLKSKFKAMSKTTAISVTVLLVIYSLGGIWRLRSMSATERYPNDTYLRSVKVKKALVIVAHDDDAIGSAGTVAMLTQQGWDVHMVCFYSSAWRPEDNPVRKKEVKQMVDIQHLLGVDVIDFNNTQTRF